ncbi:hypothetical protein XENORESO_014452 [Xenotaenia resolanae]|uniref:Secreted protein n=1 Tax=Xenotaenia resolanae TaxID=208358 RepID=A0ABV0W3M3_9TELE
MVLWRPLVFVWCTTGFLCSKKSSGFLLRYFSFNAHFSLKYQATAFLSLLQSEKCTISWSVGAGVSKLIVLTAASFLTSMSPTSKVISITPLGDFSSFFHKNSGPSNHALVFKKSETYNPLDT